jgi:hypothetical protein
MEASGREICCETVFRRYKRLQAGVAELVDARDLGSRSFKSIGSSPIIRTSTLGLIILIKGAD